MFPNNSNSSPLSVHDVRRLAPASVFVTQQNGDKPSIAAHAPKVVPAANAVLVAIQELDQLKAKQVALLAASSEQVAVLNGVMLESTRSWSSCGARCAQRWGRATSTTRGCA